MDSGAPRSGELVSVRNVTFGYGETPVLLDVTLSLFKRDFLALIGPNGSGKTTLLKVILGLLKPGRGEVSLMGESVGCFRDWQKIGYIPQKATHVDPMFPASVREVVAMALFSNRRILGLTRRQGDEAISRALRQVGMEPYAKVRIGRLSGGQQQRVFIARALVTRPEILFLDEPTTGVDSETQGRFYELLAGLNREEGLSIVVVTHDIGIVNKHINQVACLNQSLIYHGSHEEFCRTGALKEMLSGGDHLVAHEH
jgi:zinc transport system ATP-binding protein